MDEGEVTVHSVNCESKLIPLFGVLAFASYYNRYESIYRGLMGNHLFYLPT